MWTQYNLCKTLVHENTSARKCKIAPFPLFPVFKWQCFFPALVIMVQDIQKIQLKTTPQLLYFCQLHLLSSGVFNFCMVTFFQMANNCKTGVFNFVMIKCGKHCLMVQGLQQTELCKSQPVPGSWQLRTSEKGGVCPLIFCSSTPTMANFQREKLK